MSSEMIQVDNALTKTLQKSRSATRLHAASCIFKYCRVTVIGPSNFKQIGAYHVQFENSFHDTGGR